MRFRLAVASAVVVAAGLVSCAGNSQPANAMCAGTTPNSQVVVYSTTGLEYWYSDTFSTFQQTCKVAISYFGAPSSDVLTRLQTEQSAPLADIAVMFPPYLTAAADAGLIGGTPGAADVPADRCDPGRRWCEVAEDYVSWVYNPGLVSPPPTRWSDLLASRFAGMVVTSGPDVPIGLADVLLLRHEMGDAGAFNFLTQLEASTAAHYTVTDTMSRVVAEGGALVANGDLQEDLNDIPQYQYVAIWFPTVEGGTPTTIALPYGAALVRGGHNAGNARALLAYLWSSAAQSLVGEVFAAPAVPSAVQVDPRSAKVAAELSGVNIIRPDWEAVAALAPSVTSRYDALRSAPYGVSVPPTTVPVP